MSVYVCGIGVISAIGTGKEQSLTALSGGRCGIGKLSLFDSAVNVPVGEIGLSNHELKETLGLDPGRTVSRTALLGMMAAREAIEDASIEKGKRIGLVSSTSVGGMDRSEIFYEQYKDDSRRGRSREVVGHDCASSTELIASFCGITGFRTTISTACSSAANAAIVGARMIEKGLLDYVVVGGTDALCRFTLNGFNSLMILDRELCRPFDESRAGLNLGEGAGYIVLTKDPAAAKRYCRLSGYANANDAFHQTASSDNGEGAFLAMSEAIERAGIAPSEIDYINLHGTGTANNDSSEAAAIIRLFGDRIPPLSSTKSYTGHALAAAGGIEAVFSVMSIAHGIKYASLRFAQSMAGSGITPITTVIKGTPVNHVLSNSFGFGGNCSSLIFSK